MFYVLQPEAIEFCHVIVIESIKDLPPILAAANEPQLTQSTQLVGHSGLRHCKLRGKVTDIHFAIQQERNDP